MEFIMQTIKNIAENWDVIVANFGEFKIALAALAVAFSSLMGAITSILLIIYSIALIIPGQHPDKEIEWILEKTKKFSKK